MKLTKNSIKDKIGISFTQYPLIKKYFSNAAYNLIDNSENSVIKLLELQLIRYLVLKDDVLCNLEKHLSDREFTNINIPISRLKNNFSEYNAVMAELTTATKLHDEGMSDIVFIKEENNPDIEYKEDGILHYAEVKSLDELDPEYNIIYNKLEATSILNTKYEKSFYIQVKDSSLFFSSLDDYKNGLCKATDKLIQLLEKHIDKLSIDDLKIKIGYFEFIISFKTNNHGYSLMFSGDVMKFGTNKDIFLKMGSVYSRFINNVVKGVKQLLFKRNFDTTSVKGDRLYIFLNSGRYHNFIPDQLGKIIDELSMCLGIKDLVSLKIEL